MLDNVNELLANPKNKDIEVNGMKLKELLSYVRIDKETGNEISYEDSYNKKFYMIQRFQLLDDNYQDELFTKLYGESKKASEIAKEYLTLAEKLARGLIKGVEVE